MAFHPYFPYKRLFLVVLLGREVPLFFIFNSRLLFQIWPDVLKTEALKLLLGEFPTQQKLYYRPGVFTSRVFKCNTHVLVLEYKYPVNVRVNVGWIFKWS